MTVPQRIVSVATFAARSSRSSTSSYLAQKSPATCACQSLRSPRASAYSNALDSRTRRPLLSSRLFSTTPSPSSSSSFRLSSKETHEKTTNTPPREHYSEEIPEEEEEAEEEYYSPHQPKRQWPPDMSKLSPKHQLRLERKYRRRAALKYARPGWVKATKLIQWGVIIFVVIYSVLFMEWDKEGEKHPFENFRREFFATFNSVVSTPHPPGRKTDDKESK